MFNQSTQKKYWLMADCEKIAEAQMSSNKIYISKYIDLCLKLNITAPQEYLAYHEERMLLIYYSHFVYEVCRKFKPPVPMSVVGMSVMYFKRFYLSTSVMEFHPNDVAYLCVYLACKVDEYNVSIDQFMAQSVSSPQPYLQMFIIDNELLLLQKLNYHLTVHSPYRPLEGFLIDLKTRKRISGVDVEQYRPSAEKFLTNSLLTDACLLYPPSQIALAALAYSIGKECYTYLQELSGNKSIKKLVQIIENVKEMVVNFKFPSKDEISAIEEKLENCRDHENSPDSEYYHHRELIRKEAKDLEKKRKYQELYDMQNSEEKVLAQDMSIEYS